MVVLISSVMPSCTMVVTVFITRDGYCHRENAEGGGQSCTSKLGLLNENLQKCSPSQWTNNFRPIYRQHMSQTFCSFQLDHWHHKQNQGICTMCTSHQVCFFPPEPAPTLGQPPHTACAPSPQASKHVCSSTKALGKEPTHCSLDLKKG